MSTWTSYGSASLFCQFNNSERCLTKAPLRGFFLSGGREEHKQKAEIDTRGNMMKNNCVRETASGH